MSPAVREVRMRRAACLLVTVLCVLLFLAAPAHAAFPGLDGKLAFEASNNRQHDIYAVNPDGSGQANLTQSPEDDYSPAWSADGRKIAFTRASPYPPGGNSHIWVMNSDGSLQIDLIPLMSGDSAGPAWSPDGSKIAFANIDCPVYPDNGLCISDLYTMNAN